MKKLVLLSFLFLLAGGLKAQPYIGMHFIGSSAQNMFCDSAYRHGYGFNMEFFSNNLLRNSVNPNALDLRFGFGFDIQGAGREKRSVILATPNSDPGKEVLKNSHLGASATMRLTFLGEKRLHPYVDGFIGLRGFYSNRELTIDKPNPDYETTTSEQILSAGTTRYGGSFGLMYRLNRVVSIDTRVTYSDGSAGNWLNLNTVNQEDNIVSYRVSNTTTDLFIYRVGFVFNLNPEPKKTSGTTIVNPITSNDSIAPLQQVTPVETPKKKRRIDVTPSPTPSPKPSPKKPLEVKPLPPPAPKPKPLN
ncbi:MAG TPA: hypothetical protein DIW47_04115 [Bacteroidetes bacterium]|nr:hypothetical protein [Bacteroidota bacterium]